MDCTHFVTFLLCSKPFGLPATIDLLPDYARQLCASNEKNFAPDGTATEFYFTSAIAKPSQCLAPTVCSTAVSSWGCSPISSSTLRVPRTTALRSGDRIAPS